MMMRTTMDPLGGGGEQERAHNKMLHSRLLKEQQLKHLIQLLVLHSLSDMVRKIHSEYLHRSFILGMERYLIRLKVLSMKKLHLNGRLVQIPTLLGRHVHIGGKSYELDGHVENRNLSVTP